MTGMAWNRGIGLGMTLEWLKMKEVVFGLTGMASVSVYILGLMQFIT
jgi:hypothetical protein